MCAEETREWNPKLRVGVIGAGWWATSVYLPLLEKHPCVEIRAICRLGEAEANMVKTRFGATTAFTEYRQMLQSTKLDAILIASPNNFHFEHALAALEHGANVFVDKPMTTKAIDAVTLVRRAEAVNRKLVVSYGWNFSTLVKEAHRLMTDIGVGDIQHLALHMGSALTDLFSGNGLMEAESAMFRPAASTWADPNNAGGYAWGQLSHALGLLFRVTDLKPSSVFALTGISRTGVDLYDAAVVGFTNGAIGTISGAATLPKHLDYQIDLRIFGTEGVLLLDIERERLELRRHDGRDITVRLESGAGAYPNDAALNTFISMCLGEDTPNHASGAVGLRAVSLLEALHKSVKSGQLERTQH